MIEHGKINHSFRPRDMLKGPKRSFVVVVLVGVDSSAKNVTKVIKNVTKGTKNVREQNLFQIEHKMALNLK